MSLLESLVFIINYDKSKLVPDWKCKYLGFMFNSRELIIELPLDKRARGLEAIKLFLKLKSCKIRTFAKLIGQLNYFCPAMGYGWL